MEKIKRKLETLGYTPEKIEKIINSYSLEKFETNTLINKIN